MIDSVKRFEDQQGKYVTWEAYELLRATAVLMANELAGIEERIGKAWKSDGLCAWRMFLDHNSRKA